MTIQLSLRDAKRIVLAAQGFGKRHGVLATPARLHQALDRLGLFQIDSVNVLARAHYLPAYSRIGRYDLGELEQAAWGGKRNHRMFEYWAHEASLLTLDLHPLFRWRMARAERGEIGYSALRRFATVHRQKAQSVLGRIAAEGPHAASDFEGDASKGGWRAWSETKHALEWLFWSGQITTATRRADQLSKNPDFLIFAHASPSKTHAAT